MHTYTVARRDHVRDFCLWFLGTAFALSCLPALPLLVTNPTRQEFADYYTDEVIRQSPARNLPLYRNLMSLSGMVLAQRVETLNLGVGTLFFTPEVRGDRAVVLGFAHCFIPLHQTTTR